MFMGVALAIGPASMVFLLARSGEPFAVRRTFTLAAQLFQISTACYGLGIAFGIYAGLSDSLDLTAHWLITAYILVALLGLHGILFDRWTKRTESAMAVGGDPSPQNRSVGTRMPGYLLSAMFVGDLDRVCDGDEGHGFLSSTPRSRSHPEGVVACPRACRSRRLGCLDVCPSDPDFVPRHARSRVSRLYP